MERSANFLVFPRVQAHCRSLIDRSLNTFKRSTSIHWPSLCVQPYNNARRGVWCKISQLTTSCNCRHFVIWSRTTFVEVSLQSWERELFNAVYHMRVRCTVAELSMKKRWLVRPGCGRNYQPITSACGATVPTVIPMLLSNAQVLRLWHAVDPIRKHPSGMQSRPRAVHMSPSSSRPLAFCSMYHEQLSLSHRHSLRSLTSVVWARCSAEVKPTHDDSSPAVGAWCSDEKLFTSHFLTDAKPLCPCSTSELTANFFWTAVVVAVDRLPRSMMLQFRFVFRASLRAHGSDRHHNCTHAYL